MNPVPRGGKVNCHVNEENGKERHPGGHIWKGVYKTSGRRCQEGMERLEYLSPPLIPETNFKIKCK